MFTKQEIKERLKQVREEARLNGLPEEEAGLNLALIILAMSSFGKKVHSGEDFSSHPMTVAMSGTQSKTKKIISILHDVIEDDLKNKPEEERWTLDDLREVGFIPRIVDGVDGVTMRPGEKYFDFIVRCGMSGDDAIDVKISDLHHNSDPTRYRHIHDSDHAVWKQKAYNIAYHYLVDLKKIRGDGGGHYNYPGTSIVDYVRSRKEYAAYPEIVNELLGRFSSSPERLAVAGARVAFGGTAGPAIV